ncbi:hypothetical protein [Burkholderia sp. lig30]|jgi:hypothetical protein|uniref:hypothetical protein n=1 Tax=Burkholderia sp. lig30 TaxID=1192124 RepID=UPI00069136FF|nr:hypothetical protein [Burkholderia sp. lig30]
MPLKGVPFGREWTFRSVPGARSGKAYLAELVTSCIDVKAPHRACRWMPLDSPAAAAATPPATALRAAAPRPFEARAHRGTYATCWTVGALTLIGWLIVAHEPPARLVAPVREAQSAASAAPDAARLPFAIPARTTQPVEQHTVTGRIRAATIAPTPSQDATPAPPVNAHLPADADRYDTAPARNAKPRAEPPPHPPAAERQPAPTRRVASPAAPPAGEAERVATRPRPAPPAVRAAIPAEPPAHDGALDDPRTLIAMADALRAERPALTRAAPSSGTDADWSARLTHRRLTDAPDAFAR